MSFIICTERISRYTEEECYGEFKKWESELYNGRGDFSRFKAKIW